MNQIVDVLQGDETLQVEFPADMSPEEIQEVLRREFPATDDLDLADPIADLPSTSELADPRPDSTVVEEFRRGFGRLAVDFDAFTKDLIDQSFYKFFHY